MRAWRAVTALLFLCATVCLPSARAAIPMGIPMATLEEGQWTLTSHYGRAETDLQARGAFIRTPDVGASTYGYERIDLDGFSTDMLFASAAYGICDNWDVFLRLGLADARGDLSIRTASDGSDPEQLRYDGSHGLAYGIGTRATVCRWGPWSFGGLAQITWLDPDGDDYVSRDPEAANTVSVGCLDIKAWQTQVALAAVYQIDTLHFWTGPFLEFTDGQYDRKGRTYVSGVQTGVFRASGDIEEAARAGMHCGGVWEASPRFRYLMEGQFTADSWLFGLGVTFTPDRPSRGL